MLMQTLAFAGAPGTFEAQAKIPTTGLFSYLG